MFLGYEPVWQDVFGTETGDLRAVLRQKIDGCKGVLQLVGCCYGAEPPTVDPKFGRVSYTQYEALYARSRNKKTWYLFIDEHFPVDACDNEPQELHELQAAYRQRVKADAHVFHPLTTAEGLEASVLKLRDDLVRLRRGVKQWAAAIAALLMFIAVVVTWQMRNQAQMKNDIASKIERLEQSIRDYPRIDAQVRSGSGSDETRDEAKIEEQVYADLGRRFGVDAKTVREVLPRIAERVRRAPDASAQERANAAYVAKDFSEAERLALQSADDAAKMAPPNLKLHIESLELAGLSAQRQIQYARAEKHFTAAEKLADRSRDLEEWARLQQEMADLSFAKGRYNEAERLTRTVIEARTRALGAEHADTLDSGHRLIFALIRQTKIAEAEKEAREVLQLREKVLGYEHPQTLTSRAALAHVLANQGKNPEAEALYRHVIGLTDKVLGSQDPRSVAAREGLADVLVNEGKNEEAEVLYRQIIKVDAKLLGLEHTTTLNDRMNLATVLQGEGKFSAAEAEYRDVIKLQEKAIGSDHPDVLIGRNNLAEVLIDEGKYAEAEAQCRQIIGTEEKILGPENQLTLNSRANLVLALIGESKSGDTEVQYENVLEEMERVLGLEHPDTLNYASKFTAALAHQNKTQQAKALADRLAEHARHNLGPDNSSTQRYMKLAQGLQASR